MNNPIRFVLVETTHSGNIGAAARAMKTMGFSELRLVSPCKYQTTEALARASGADEIVTSARVFDTLADAISDCTLVYGTSARPRALEWSVAVLEEAARDMAATVSCDNPGSAAVVFGRERSGLSNDELALCNRRLSIPSNPEFSSLNLGSAVQVVAYELHRALHATTPPLAPAVPQAQSVQDSVDEPAADSQSMEHFYQHLQRIMIQTEFLDPDNPRLLMRRLRRFFSRSQPRTTEVQILRGILAAVEKKLNR